MKRTTTFPTLFALLLVLFSGALAAQNSTTISIQGTLKDANGTAVPDGMREVTFRLYDTLVAGDVLWTETAEVSVVGGIYSHQLGSVEPLVDGDFSSTVYLGIVVGSLELTPRTAMSYAPYALSVASAQRVAQRGCSGQVGDVKYSILDPTAFAMENGDCWVPMDGRAVPGTRLATVHGMASVPDMSGLFIRATEYNDGNDPDRDAMAAVSMQGDETKSHTHTTSVSGEHTHAYEDSYVSTMLSDQGSAGFSTGSAPRGGGSPWFGIFGGFNITRLGWLNTLEDATTESGGGHSHTVNANDGGESRPKNMNFYVYIRVD